MKKQETESSATKKRALEGLQKGSVARIHRNSIVEDDINPRVISAENAKRLKESIKKNGLVGHLVWNKQTGHIVGGHQRLEAIDSIMRSKDYEMDVLVVDLPIKEEIRLNVVLNNTDNMGVFDYAKLQNLSLQFELDVGEDFGFSQEVIDIQFPKAETEPVIIQNDDGTTDLMYEEPPRRVASEEDIAKMKEMKKAGREALKEGKEEFGDFRHEAKGVLTVVFQCETNKKEWLKSINLPEDKNVVSIEEIEMPLLREIQSAYENGTLSERGLELSEDDSNVDQS